MTMTSKQLRRHLQRIGAIGGSHRAANLSPEELSQGGRTAGLASAAGRLAKMPAKKRSQIARKAARARWAARKGQPRP